MKLHQIAIAASLLLGAQITATAAVTLLDDAFSSGTDLVSRQNTPTSMNWYQSGSAASNVSFNTTAHTLTATNGIMVTGNFMPSGSPQALSVGDSISVSINFSLNAVNNVSNAIRLGLLNSGGNQLTSIGQGYGGQPSGYSFTGTTGYGAFFNPAGTASIAERSTSAATLFTGGGMATVGTSQTLVPLSAATNYLMTLTITRTTSTTDLISFDLNGVTTSYSDSTVSTNAFDSFSLLFNPGVTTSDIIMKEVLIQYTAVPEPSTAALLLGGLMLLIVTAKMRRAASFSRHLA